MAKEETLSPQAAFELVLGELGKLRKRLDLLEETLGSTSEAFNILEEVGDGVQLSGTGLLVRLASLVLAGVKEENGLIISQLSLEARLKVMEA